jgi:DNA ligase-1
MYISEKLDGTRVFWDGGVSRGVPTDQVPWASIINPKTGNRKDKIKSLATGLWSRYGNPVMAPDWWLNLLPAMFLDGELFAGRGNFQTLRSIVAKDVADEDAWRDVQFAVFGMPPIGQVFTGGEIKNPNFHLQFDPAAATTFFRKHVEQFGGEFIALSGRATFVDELSALQSALPQDDRVYLHRQILLPNDQMVAKWHMDAFIHIVLEEGGEGVILRDPKSIWTPKRVGSLLKWKPFTDDVGTLVGFISGRETNKGSKLLGMVGAVVLEYNGKRLELSGFTDEERRFSTPEATRYAATHPGEEMPRGFEAKHFSIGEMIEFRYRELSDDGIPKEARYKRSV